MNNHYSLTQYRHCEEKHDLRFLVPYHAADFALHSSDFEERHFAAEHPQWEGAERVAVDVAEQHFAAGQGFVTVVVVPPADEVALEEVYVF